MAENENTGFDREAFFLNHLKSVKADKEWYINQKFLGKGGNGVAFLVTCTSGPNKGVQFALKVFYKIRDNVRRNRFLEEIGHYQALSHPAIINIYDEGVFHVGETQYPFAVVDYVPENMEAKLGRGLPQIPRLEAVRYLMNIASGVAYLHAQEEPIVHRDIKPANILLDSYRAKLGDLGLAKVLVEGAEGDETDVEAYAAGPRYYRTPEMVERASGQGTEITPASDVFQLGLVLYRAITGFNPLKTSNAFTDAIELDVRNMHGAAASRLNLLVSKMLELDPASRPSASEVLNQLQMIHKQVCSADQKATGIMR